MPQSIKFIAFFFVVVNVVTIFKPSLRPSGDNGPIHIVNGKPVVSKVSREKQILQTFLVIGAILGSIVLAIDAWRREYDEPKAMPMTLAIMGIFSLGITSIVYYLGWGSNPTRPPRSQADRFCQRCISQSLDTPVSGLFIHQHITGVRLVGSSDRCDQCGSTIKTRWFFIIVPLIPFGSYRVLLAEKSTLVQAAYLSRKLPAMNRVQIATRYVMLALIAGGVAGVACI